MSNDLSIDQINLAKVSLTGLMLGRLSGKSSMRSLSPHSKTGGSGKGQGVFST